MKMITASMLLFIAIGGASAQGLGCPVSSLAEYPVASVQKISALAQLKPKGEYETNAAVHARVLQIISTETVNFSVQIPDSLVQYDAENSRLNFKKLILPMADEMIKIPTSGPFDKYYNSVSLRSTRKTKGKYVGQNSFGAVATVDQIDATRFGVAWASRGPSFNPPDDISISLSPDEAKQQRKELRLLLVGSLDAPFVISDADYSAATIDAPEDYSVKKTGIVVVPICAAIYNPHTGQILASWSPSPGF